MFTRRSKNVIEQAELISRKDHSHFKPICTRLKELLPSEILEKALKKSGLEDPDLSSLALRETLRFLFLGAHRGGVLFFTGNKAVDDIWHFLITETEFYARFCNHLKKGVFLHHSGIPYSVYCEGKKPDELLKEHFSWLASYVLNFGAIEPESLSFIPIAAELMRQVGVDLAGLNALAIRLIESSDQLERLPFSWNAFLDRIEAKASSLDSDPDFLFGMIRQFLQGSHQVTGQAPGNEELIEVYSRSSAFGFTLWQHLAALERIECSEDWCKKNADLFRDIKQGDCTVGLATTHLAKESGSPLKGVRVDGGYILNGQVPWCSGFSYFNKVILGFETEAGIGFAMSSMPGKWAANPKWTVSRLDLSVLDATNTVSAILQDLFVSDVEIISFREKTVKASPRESRFRMPELGMAIGALRAVEKRLAEDSKFKSIRATLDALQARVAALIQIARDQSVSLTDRHQLEKADLIRRSNQLLVIASGGSAIREGSEVSRRSLEAMLLDIVIQPPSLLRLKTQSLC